MSLSNPMEKNLKPNSRDKHKIMRAFVQFCINKFENFDTIHNFLEKYKSKIMQKKIYHAYWEILFSFSFCVLSYCDK